MKKLIFITVAVVLSAMVTVGGANVAFAQTATDDQGPDTVIYYNDFDDNYYKDATPDAYYDYDYDTTDYNDEDVVAAMMLFSTTMMLIFVPLMIIMWVVWGLIYWKIAQKLGHEYPWWAWVPILNLIQFFQLGEQSPWWILLLFVPVIGWIAALVFVAMIYMKIAEKMGQESWVGLLIFLPLVNIILPAVWAFGDYPKTGEAKTE